MAGRRGGGAVVLVALAGNVGVAAAKFVAYMLSGSSAILTEAIHSSVDSIDQVLLLVGQHRAKRHRDRSHPLGYGMEMYFWSFIVALLVFGAGGIASVFEGISRILRPADTSSLTINLAVLGVAAIFESTSFVFAYREYKAIVGPRETSLWQFIRASKDPNLFATLLEDGAALAGLVIAAAGILAADLGGVRWADGAASIAIGAILIGVAFVLADETRSLIAGEAVAAPILKKLRRTIADDPRVVAVRDLATLHLGPRTVMVAITAEFTSIDVDELAACVEDLSASLKASDERVSYVYVRPAR